MHNPVTIRRNNYDCDRLIFTYIIEKDSTIFIVNLGKFIVSTINHNSVIRLALAARFTVLSNRSFHGDGIGAEASLADCKSSGYCAPDWCYGYSRAVVRPGPLGRGRAS